MAALEFKVVSSCPTSKARAAILRLPHYDAMTPMFMPVGTKGTIKGVTSTQLEQAGCQVILGNTYHLMLKPGEEVLTRNGGLHTFMNWRRGLLTDSGGFQMVSLAALASVSENGVTFASHYDGTEHVLTPERSVEIQHAIGADIIMQLDDVVSPLSPRSRIEEGVHRSIRWLDRCIAAHPNTNRQNLFAIVQGGTHADLRAHCIAEMAKRDTPGYAIGGLSGGEQKDLFWRTVKQCADLLPSDRPRYCMGIGYPLDLVVCTALGVDMYDCVFPTRTARFGNALVPTGILKLSNSSFRDDNAPIDAACPCVACQTTSRAQLHFNHKNEVSALHLISIHNITYMMNLTNSMHQSILEGAFPEFVKRFCTKMFPEGSPQWAIDAFASVNVFVE